MRASCTTLEGLYSGKRDLSESECVAGDPPNCRKGTNLVTRTSCDLCRGLKGIRWGDRRNSLLNYLVWGPLTLLTVQFKRGTGRG